MRRASLPWLVVAALAVGLVVVLVVWMAGRAMDEEVAGSMTTETTDADTVPEETQTDEARPEPSRSTGRSVYLSAGCGACHGPKAEGSPDGPALAGHTARQVRQQVRSPLGQMPAYTEAQISAADLEKLATYIAGLAPTAEHVEPVNVSEILAMHHWMAISAIAAGNRRDALHHVGHVVERVKGDHLAAIRRVRALVRQGKLHDAQHLLEELLAGKAKPDLTPAQINLRLALTAIDQGDGAEARHQVRHYRARVRGVKREEADAILAQLRRGDLHGADHGISALLGLGHR